MLLGDVIVPRRRHGLLDFQGETLAFLDLDDQLSHNNQTASTNLQITIATLEATTTLTNLHIHLLHYKATPENNARFIEPFCRCIANLRRHNPNHPLTWLCIQAAETKDDCDIVDQLLFAAKQFGIQHLRIVFTRLPIQSLVEFGRDNRHLKVLDLSYSNLFFSDKEDESTISILSPKDGPQQKSSAILALDELYLNEVNFDNPSVARTFSNFIANMTYPVLELVRFTVGGVGGEAEEHGGADVECKDKDRKEKKISHLRVMSKLIKQSLEQLTLHETCRIEAMDAIHACATVTQIQLCDYQPPSGFLPDAVLLKLQVIAWRNRKLARFVANPSHYPGDELLALMSQFDRCPTGRYMLARCVPEIPGFFKIMITDPSTARLKKRRKIY